MSEAAILRQALELLGPNGENWFQVRPDRECTGNVCAYIAIGRAQRALTEGDSCKADGFLRKAIGESSIIKWNDQADDFGVIKAGFEKAIQLAEATQ